MFDFAQHSNNKRIVSFGEVMMRLSPPGHERFSQTEHLRLHYGGSEANVAVSLSRLGLAAEHVTCVSSNDFGTASVQWLNRHGVYTGNIISNSSRIGLYFLEHGAMQRASRVIYDRSDSAFATMKEGSFDWDKIMQQASWFHWSGITPAISAAAASLCKEALIAAKKHKVVVSGDINYRRNLWQYGKNPKEIMPELISFCDHIVGGVSDFENCCGITGKTFDEACTNMSREFPNLKSFSTTVRDQPSASKNILSGILFKDGKQFETQHYELTNIVDRIGAGDAYMAGLIYGYVNKFASQEIIDFATAACVWKHSVEGDVNLASAAEIHQLVKGENVGKLLR